MKRKNSAVHNLVLVFLTLFAGTLSSCLENKYKELDENLNYSNFDYKTTKEISVNINTLNNSNQPIEGVYIELYTQNPLNEAGNLISDSEKYLIQKGITDKNGVLKCKIAPASYVDSLIVIVEHIGLPVFQQYKINSTEMNLTIGGANNSSKVSSAPAGISSVVALPSPQKVNGYYVLGSWDNSGYPAYLWGTKDLISNELLSDINASLPEKIKLPVSHPEYINSVDEGNIVLIEDAEVWVTFVHEGAGYLNTLGYYTHPNDNPPTSKASITDATIVFPNVSFSGSGGSLISGNKVQLLYLDKATNTYTTVFPKGTTIAWFFIANGFTGNKIGSGYATYYSDKRFNPEKNDQNKKHNVILNDTKRQLLLIGFEDLNRENGSDEDFNDGVFYSTVTPYTAVKTNNLKPLDTPKNNDSDGDGVSDSRDEYPYDSERAFNNYYPGKNEVGTLTFEDLWPSKGDYDFNDLVLNYNFNQVTNAANQIVDVVSQITVKAIGASMRNPFVITFNTPSENVKSVTGQNLSKNIFSLNANNTEANQKNATVPVFDDPFKVIGFIGSIVNSVNGGAYAAPKTITVTTTFKNPVNWNDFGTAPYNPFIVKNGVRGNEIHLPGSLPTDLADKTLFGTFDDESSIAAGKYYVSEKYLPWAMNIPVDFEYPVEKESISNVYLMMKEWALSKGYNYMDWYLDKPGYRNYNKIFKK